MAAAEFRGNIYRNQFEGNQDDYEVDTDRSRGFSVRSGRIILLGDGTEVIPDQSEEELFEEDRDLANQAQRELPDATRNEREGTPGPQVKSDGPQAEESTSASISESPSSTTAETSSGGANAAPEKPASS